MKRLAVVLLVIAIVLLAAGCGGGKKTIKAEKNIKRITSCLEDAKMTTEHPKTDDKDTAEGVIGINFNPEEKNPQDATMAVAAVEKSDKGVDDFKKVAKRRLADAKDREGMSAESGTDGRYVWMVAGSTKSDVFKKSRDCVKP